MSVYALKGKPPAMRRSVVALLDLLGYKEMVRDAKTPTEQGAILVRVHDALRRARGKLRTKYSRELYEVRFFTDNVVLGWPIADRSDGETELGHTLISVGAYQAALAKAGFFVRGGIAIGDLYMDRYAVFGPALVEAYTLESSVAVYPRVILDAAARGYVVRHFDYYADPRDCGYNNELAVDDDGQIFVNYLDAARLTNDPNVLPYYRGVTMLRHRRRTRAQLREHRGNPRVLEKYRWVARYHNFVCDYLYPGDTALRVPRTNVTDPRMRRLIP